MGADSGGFLTYLATPVLLSETIVISSDCFIFQGPHSKRHLRCMRSLARNAWHKVRYEGTL